jgi:hypothetical protein
MEVLLHDQGEKMVEGVINTQNTDYEVSGDQTKDCNENQPLGNKMDGMKLLNIDSFLEIEQYNNVDDDNLHNSSSARELSPILSIESKTTDSSCASTDILNMTCVKERNDSLSSKLQSSESKVIGEQAELKISSTLVTSKVAELDDNELDLLSMDLNTEADFDKDCNLIEKRFENNQKFGRVPTKDDKLQLSLRDCINLNEKLAVAESNIREQEVMNEKNREWIDKLTIENIDLQNLVKKFSKEMDHKHKNDTEEDLLGISQNDEQLSLNSLDNEIQKNEILEIENTRLRNLYSDREKDLELSVESTRLLRSECLEEKMALSTERQDFFIEQNSFFFEKQDLLEEVFRLKSELKVSGLEDTANGLIEKDIILEEIEKMKLGKNRSEKKFKEILHTNETNISRFENTITALEMLKVAMENRIDQVEDEKMKEIEKHELLVEGLLKAAGLHQKVGNEENDSSNYLIHLFMKQVDEERLKVNALKSCLMQFGSQLSDDDNKVLLDSGIILIPNGISPLDSPPSPIPVPATLSSRFRWNKGEKKETSKGEIKDTSTLTVLDSGTVLNTEEIIPSISPPLENTSVSTKSSSRFRWGRSNSTVSDSGIILNTEEMIPSIPPPLESTSVSTKSSSRFRWGTPKKIETNIVDSKIDMSTTESKIDANTIES